MCAPLALERRASHGFAFQDFGLLAAPVYVF